jgi:hypothetical protein
LKYHILQQKVTVTGHEINLCLLLLLLLLLLNLNVETVLPLDPIPTSATNAIGGDIDICNGRSF